VDPEVARGAKYTYPEFMEFKLKPWYFDSQSWFNLKTAFLGAGTLSSEEQTYAQFYKLVSDLAHLIPALVGGALCVAQVCLSLYAVNHPLETLQWLNGFDLSLRWVDDPFARYAEWDRYAAANRETARWTAIFAGAVPLGFGAAGWAWFHALGENVFRYVDANTAKVVWQLPLGYAGYLPAAIASLFTLLVPLALADRFAAVAGGTLPP